MPGQVSSTCPSRAKACRLGAAAGVPPVVDGSVPVGAMVAGSGTATETGGAAKRSSSAGC